MVAGEIKVLIEGVVRKEKGTVGRERRAGAWGKNFAFFIRKPAGFFRGHSTKRATKRKGGQGKSANRRGTDESRVLLEGFLLRTGIRLRDQLEGTLEVTRCKGGLIRETLFGALGSKEKGGPRG